MASRPEHLAPPEIYYDREEASRYTQNSHIRSVQIEMCERALEMLLLPQDERNLILDIGCGSGLSGKILSENNNFWIGVDISTFMLDEALRNGSDKEGDMILGDIGERMNIVPGVFDGAISISALQWLCVANKSSQDPFKRLLTFFRWLYRSLSYGARAAIQFYPENAMQLEMITSAASKCSFGGGLVVDFPDSTRAKKYYLCIWTGVTGILQTLPDPLGDPKEQADFGRAKRMKKSNKQSIRSKILKKKQQQRNRGIATRPDSRYTGRPRPMRF